MREVAASGRLVAELTGELDDRLAGADAELAARYPGEPTSRQPVHTVYVPADRFDAGTPAAWGAAALELLDRFAPDAERLAALTDLPVDQVCAVHDRVRDKLATEPVEDLRVDFEDGYGRRPDAEEDADLLAAVAALTDPGAVRPPFVGVRFKSFEPPTRARGLATLVGFLVGVAGAGTLPEGCVVTLPKVTSVDQVLALVHVCERLEQHLGLAAGAVRFEIQVETAQAVLGADGRATVAPLVHAAAGRCTGLHYGTFDYSAGLGIAAAYQSLDHPAADHAKAVMQVAAAQTGVRLSDGSTNVVAFADAEQAGDTWRLHTRLVTRGLERGFYQGWDLHPGHLPTRYLAGYVFFRRAMGPAADRLRAYRERSADGSVLDEPATARMLASVLLRGIRCGATDEHEVVTRCGLDAAGLVHLSADVAGPARQA